MNIRKGALTAVLGLITVALAAQQPVTTRLDAPISLKEASAKYYCQP